MQFIDTHSHFYTQDFDRDRDDAVAKSLQVGVSHILLPNIDLESVPRLLDTCKKYPDMCFPMLGLHPCDVKKNYQMELQKIFDCFGEHHFIGIGEIGIDLYWEQAYLEEQKEAFRWQIAFALEQDLPIVVHKRQSYYETIAVLNEFKNDKLRGIFHCYSGSVAHAEEVIDKGFLLGIGGTVTYKSSKLDEVLPHIPLDKIVLETDAPYLTPVPHRGLRNNSHYLPLIAQKIADIKQVSIEEVAEQTTQNAKKMFSL
ncbi:MAG: TatD family hydrolase [Lentimicrobiaceae bacterium]|nr:TatD family hydrolase [Lentimicrobiaceae bacterium]